MINIYWIPLPNKAAHKLIKNLAKRVLIDHNICPSLLIRSPAGKPELSDCSAFISWSHSDQMAVIGFSQQANLGIDIEKIRNISPLSLSQRLCEQSQQRIIKARCPLHEFFTIWTAKEAQAKHAGSSIWRYLKKAPAYHTDSFLFPTHYALSITNPLRLPIQISKLHLPEMAAHCENEKWLPAG